MITPLEMVKKWYFALFAILRVGNTPLILYSPCDV
jgi:hypothetical protein